MVNIINFSRKLDFRAVCKNRDQLFNEKPKSNPVMLEHNKTVVPADPLKLILLGEDDIDDQEFLEEAICTIDNSYKLECVSNGKNLINYLEGLKDEFLPILIVLDYNLPILSGAEILQELSSMERYKKIPKLVWSTSNSPVCKTNCLDFGASDYIVKPKDMISLRETAIHMLSFCK
jgi:CheY-like chemotaxis protein